MKHESIGIPKPTTIRKYLVDEVNGLKLGLVNGEASRRHLNDILPHLCRHGDCSSVSLLCAVARIRRWSRQFTASAFRATDSSAVESTHPGCDFMDESYIEQVIC